MCEFSQLPPGVMQDLTPLTQVNKVITLNKYFAGNFSLINAQRPLCFFLLNFSNTIAELPESCKFTGRSLTLPGQSRIPSDTSNSVQELCGFHLQGSIPMFQKEQTTLTVPWPFVPVVLSCIFISSPWTCLRLPWTVQRFCRNCYMEEGPGKDNISL